ncbi:MAG: hypothetical protein ACK5WR_10505 [Planctomycetaceae bacterium]
MPNDIPAGGQTALQDHLPTIPVRDLSDNLNDLSGFQVIVPGEFTFLSRQRAADQSPCATCEIEPTIDPID